MKGKDLTRRAAERTEELPGSEVGQPFGPDWDVFKVAGRVFMLLTEVTGEAMVVLKADPTDAVALREAHAAITPGYHMNKRHWISLHSDGSLPGELVDDLVAESYLLVLEGLPRSRRPVDPDAFRAALGWARD